MTDVRDPARAQLQLAVIALLTRTLDEHGIDHWLFGGWAVDFWVGSITRDHDDIDMAACWSDSESIGRVLETAGWRHTPAPGEVADTRYRWGGTEVEFTFVVDDADGRVIIPFDEPVVWSTQPFGRDRQVLLGVGCRLVQLDVIKKGKSEFNEGVGRAPAAKDFADAAALAALGAPSEPPTGPA